MIVYVLEAGYKEWEAYDRWDACGLFRTFTGAREAAETDEKKPLEWTKQQTIVAAGEWWLATTHDKWGHLWRIIQLNLLD